MKTFGSLAESITGRPASPLLSNGDRPCECGEWYPSHACWTCHDAGRIATSRGRAGESWVDFWARVGERAGVSVACPACVRTATVDPVAELDRMHVPVRFREVTIDSWRYPGSGMDGGAIVREWVSAWPPSRRTLLLTGGKGAGKTHLACGAIKAILAQHGRRSAFWREGKLLDRYRRASSDTATESVEEIDRELEATDCVVIDDLGTAKETEFVRERVFRLIDDRYGDMRALIVTTNLALGELDTRVASRLRDGVVVQFAGKDQRG